MYRFFRRDAVGVKVGFPSGHMTYVPDGTVLTLDLDIPSEAQLAKALGERAATSSSGWTEIDETGRIVQQPEPEHHGLSETEAEVPEDEDPPEDENLTDNETAQMLAALQDTTTTSTLEPEDDTTTPEPTE